MHQVVVVVVEVGVVVVKGWVVQVGVSVVVDVVFRRLGQCERGAERDVLPLCVSRPV